MRTNTINTAILKADLARCAEDLNNAQRAYKESCQVFWQRLDQNLPEVPFWDMLIEYRDLVKRGNGSKWAAREFFRKAAYDHPCRFTLGQAIVFARRYALLCRQLYEAVDAAPFRFLRTDDGYGDLMDSLPIAGELVCSRLLNGEYGSLNGFENDVRSFSSV